MNGDSRKYWALAILACVLVGCCYLGMYLTQQLAVSVKARRARPPRRPPVAIPANPAVPREGDELLGTKPVEWMVGDWVNSEPLTLASLRGKVVLVRWWTSPGCPYCEGTAPTLNDFWQRYHDKGLEVIGLYHHKAELPLTRAHVATQVEKFGFEFPVAIDVDWKTLHRWWLDTVPRRGRFTSDRQYTSVTFLLDREGIIRQIHPGGVIQQGTPDYEALVRAIEELLARPAGAR